MPPQQTHHSESFEQQLSRQQQESMMPEFLRSNDHFHDRCFTAPPHSRNDGPPIPNARPPTSNAGDHERPPQSPRSIISSVTPEVSSSVGVCSIRTAHLPTDEEVLSSAPSLITDTSKSSAPYSDWSGEPIIGVPLLVPDGNELMDNPTPTNPRYECCFWFLRCHEMSYNEEDWRLHCKSHFRGKAPPKSAICTLCPAEFESADGEISWAMKMDHLAGHHQAGLGLRTARPDFELFTYLWQQRIIGYPEYQELKGNYHLTRAPRPYVQSRRTMRDRRDRARPGPSVTFARLGG
jgi:hypothetical protein